MNLLLEAIIRNGLLLDAAGVVGLGLIGLAAVRLAQRERSWGGTMMCVGAIGLLIARLIVLVMPQLSNSDFSVLLSPNFLRITSTAAPFLLTLGLAGIVWGIWAHERWIRETGARE